jgi:CDGSH-type Zn-finger protein
MDEPLVAQKGPFKIELEAGRTYFWCACGRSRTQPFCDGSHKVTTITPIRHKAEKSGPAWLCGCKRSGHKPFCDGTHKTL